ncbi:DNA polymerase III subunit theta [Pantoea sp. Aalb]|uniref:DNA polymerase III subunit theta n=1 Tax=Pantoea sp. Aalb TaxID=2576762 RepID=UPI0013206AB4|nr:DNA polymerase III subunit theta [Pantoea sp. Aalb]MXP67370.1 DNA polymerase III subunit theta [Pantoea sp. Aalb]
MSYNIAFLSQENKNKLKIDLIAASIAFKERYNMPVSIKMIERKYNKSNDLRKLFNQRLIFYRSISHNFSCLRYEYK